MVVQGLLSTPSCRWGRLLWPSSCRRKTQKASGDGCSSPHGEKLVGDAGLNANGSRQPIEARRRNASAKPGAARGQRTGQAGPAELGHDIMTSRTNHHSDWTIYRILKRQAKEVTAHGFPS